MSICLHFEIEENYTYQCYYNINIIHVNVHIGWSQMSLWLMSRSSQTRCKLPGTKKDTRFFLFLSAQLNRNMSLWILNKYHVAVKLFSCLGQRTAAANSSRWYVILMTCSYLSLKIKEIEQSDDRILVIFPWEKIDKLGLGKPSRGLISYPSQMLYKGYS